VIRAGEDLAQLQHRFPALITATVNMDGDDLLLDGGIEHQCVLGRIRALAFIARIWRAICCAISRAERGAENRAVAPWLITTTTKTKGHWRVLASAPKHDDRDARRRATCRG
jgi:hypothetical protein